MPLAVYMASQLVAVKRPIESRGMPRVTPRSIRHRPNYGWLIRKNRRIRARTKVGIKIAS
jgi:hypothetical protein